MVRILNTIGVCWLLLLVGLQGSACADPKSNDFEIRQHPGTEVSNQLGTEPNIGGSKAEVFSNQNEELQGGKKDGERRVAVSTVAWLTLAMAAATGLGAVPFFFVDLEAQWAGICNGIAAGVMLAASFDLVQEGQKYGGGSWVVFGILAGGIFILSCQLYGDGFVVLFSPNVIMTL